MSKSHKASTPYIRQYAWKAKKNLPKDPQQREEVLEYLLRKEKQGSNCRKKLDFKLLDSHELESNDTLHKALTQAVKHGAKKNFSKVRQISMNLKRRYHSLRNVSRRLKGFSWKQVHKIFTPKELHEKRRIKDDDSKNVSDFFKLPVISTQLPNKKHSKLWFMTCTLEEAYKEYVKHQKKNNHRVLGLSSFCKLHLRQVELQRSMPLNQCCCDTCINFKLIRLSLKINGGRDVPTRATEAVCKSICPISDENVENSPLADILKYRRDCIFNKCPVCSDGKLALEQVTPEKGRIDVNKIVHWHRWKSTKKTINNKKCSAFE